APRIPPVSRLTNRRFPFNVNMLKFIAYVSTVTGQYSNLSYSRNCRRPTMDQAAKDRIRNEIEDEVRTLFPGAVRRVDWQSHSDDPHDEPGELLPSLVLPDPPGRRRGRPEPGQAFKKFQNAHGPAVKQF